MLLPIAAMAAVVLASNVLVQFLLGDWLTWGALTYPLAFLVTDVTNRLHGPRRRAPRRALGLSRRPRLLGRGHAGRGRVRPPS